MGDRDMGEKEMPDDKDRLHMPYGEISPDDLSTGGVGSGASSTDTGGLDVAGNELGAASPGSDEGRQEKQRETDAEAETRAG
jgi:hypothetical protein